MLESTLLLPTLNASCYPVGRGYDASELSLAGFDGHACSPPREAIIMPDDVAEEKVKALQSLGAEVQRVRPASIVDKKQVCTPYPIVPRRTR